LDVSTLLTWTFGTQRKHAGFGMSAKRRPGEVALPYHQTSPAEA